MEECRKRHSAISARRFFQKSTQTSGNTARDKGIAIAPEIHPGGGFAHDFADEICTDGKTAFAEAFLPDWIGGGVEKTRSRFRQGAKPLQTVVGLIDNPGARRCVVGFGKLSRQLRDRFNPFEPSRREPASRATPHIGDQDIKGVRLERGDLDFPADDLLSGQLFENRWLDA